MKKLCFVLTLGLVFGFSSIATAQFGGTSKPKKLGLGANGGLFRVSLNVFDDAYGERWGGAAGAHASYRFGRTFNALVKYRQFSKSADPQRDNVGAAREWKENWVNVGVRYMGWKSRGAGSYLSIGLTFFQVDEQGPSSIIPGNFGEVGESNHSGFFLDLGVNYKLMEYIALNFEAEITSANVGGLETTSIGGLFASVGLTIFPF